RRRDRAVAMGETRGVSAMRRTRLSLYYAIAYLLSGGLAFLLVPEWTMRLLGALDSYGDVLPRWLGVVNVALGVLVLQIARYHAEELYLTVVAIATGAAVTLVLIYLASREPPLLTAAVIVGIGAALGIAGYRMDRRPRAFGRVGRRMDTMEGR
ncbi:MAG: hypothetical protein LC722_08590, partial [Actinobacteria bacterium]|nr:hypothetical protein [Actinomycetota bacterium]